MLVLVHNLNDMEHQVRPTSHATVLLMPTLHAQDDDGNY